VPKTAADSRQLSVIILTRDEELNLQTALESIRHLDANVLVVDSGSTDGTLDLARSHGCEVLTNTWTTYSEQFQWAMEHLPWQTPWMMRLDADERLTPDLVDELSGQVLPIARVPVGGRAGNRGFG